jgi:hypothetical protein
MFPLPCFRGVDTDNSKVIHNVISRKSLSYTLQNKYTEIKLHIKSKQDTLINFD